MNSREVEYHDTSNLPTLQPILEIDESGIGPEFRLFINFKYNRFSC
jgi:hypothetical protein